MLSHKAALTPARKKELEDAGFIAYEFVIDGETKHLTMICYLYDPILIEEIRREIQEIRKEEAELLAAEEKDEKTSA
jgi:hypothetical protein